MKWTRAVVAVAFAGLTTWEVTAEDITVNPDDSIQDALDDVQPGDTIILAAGEYFEDFVTKVDGMADAPITIRGPWDYDPEDPLTHAIIRGKDGGRVFQLRHDYYILEHFIFDGKLGETSSTYSDILLYIHGNRDYRKLKGGPIKHKYKSAVDHVIVRNMVFMHAGGECIRLRYFVTHTEIYQNHIEDCGIFAYVTNPDSGSKNGEGIYIGTSNKQWDDGKNPTDDVDKCYYNLVYDNFFNTMGNEAVDIKEGSSYNYIERNECMGQLDEESGGINSRGNYNFFGNNIVTESRGAGVRLGGATVGSDEYGKGNVVVDNTLDMNKVSGVKIMTDNQDDMCGNIIHHTEPEEDYSFASGTYAEDHDDPRSPCLIEPGAVTVHAPQGGEVYAAGEKFPIEWEWEEILGPHKPLGKLGHRFHFDLHECVDGNCGEDNCGQYVTNLCSKPLTGCRKNKESANKKAKSSTIASSTFYKIRVSMAWDRDVYDCSEMFSITGGEKETNDFPSV